MVTYKPKKSPMSLFSLRVSDEQRAKLEALAAAEGLKPSAFLRKTAEMYAGIPEVVKEIIANISGTLGVQGSAVIERIIALHGAMLLAWEHCHPDEPTPQKFLPYLIDREGNLASTERTFGFFVNLCVDEFSDSKEQADMVKKQIIAEQRQ